MSFYTDGKKLLQEPKVREFVQYALKKSLASGYIFQDPRYSNGKPSVEIFIKRIDSEKSNLFAAAMRILGVDFICPCGVTRKVEGRYPEEIKEFKRLFIEVSGVRPIEDKNISIK